MSITIQFKTTEEVKYPIIGLSKTADAMVSVDFEYQSSVLNTDGSPSSAIFNTNISGDSGTGAGTMQVIFDYDSTLDVQEQAENKLKSIFSQ